MTRQRQNDDDDGVTRCNCGRDKPEQYAKFKAVGTNGVKGGICMNVEAILSSAIYRSISARLLELRDSSFEKSIGIESSY